MTRRDRLPSLPRRRRIKQARKRSHDVQPLRIPVLVERSLQRSERGGTGGDAGGVLDWVVLVPVVPGTFRGFERADRGDEVGDDGVEGREEVV